MIDWIQAHPVLSAIVSYAVFSSVVGAMEKPDAQSGKLYRYIYRLGHILAFNIGHAVRAKFPEYAPDKASADLEEQKLKGE